MAPEYAMEGKFRKNLMFLASEFWFLRLPVGERTRASTITKNLRTFWGIMWRENNAAVVIDGRISSPSYQEEVVRCIHIGLLCVQELPQDRPSISYVLAMLRSEIIELPEPKQSAFVLDDSGQPSQKSSSSLNNVTLTVVDGR
ncbi:hypothetical protein OROHE_010417 [Orobanche hederae]